MKTKKTTLLALLMVLLFSAFAPVAMAAPVVLSSTIYFGLDDVPKVLGGDGDYQDLVWKLLCNCSLQSTNGGGWQPMTTPNGTGTPYWNNPSFDGANENIGNYILGTGSFVGNPASPSWSLAGTQFFGKADGSASSMFIQTTDGLLEQTIKIEVASLSANNAVALLNMATNVLIPLFDGSFTAGTIVTQTLAAGQYAILTTHNGWTTSLNSTTTGLDQSISAFKQTDVPEPMTLFLMGAGLVGIAVLRRRKT